MTLKCQSKSVLLPILLIAVLLGLLGAGCTSESRKARYLKRPDQYFAAGDFEKAAIEYLNVRQIDPSNLVAIRRLGLIYHDQGKLSQAFPLLFLAKKLDPSNPDVRLR